MAQNKCTDCSSNDAWNRQQAVDYPIELIEIHPELVERNFGELEGDHQRVMQTNYYEDETAIDNFKDVESLAALQHRANDILMYLQSLPHDTILVVGHGAFGRALRRAIKKGPLHIRGENFENAKLVRLI